MLDVDAKAKHQINFTTNLGWAVKTTMYFIIEEKKQIVLRFPQRTCT